MDDFITKDDLLNKLRLYSTTPDDDNIVFKQKIKNELLNCPELLYALNEQSLESELFDEEGNINYDGEWDLYFSSALGDGNIRPYLYIPQTQDETRNFLCYQTSFDEIPRYNSVEKYALITFTIIINGSDRIDKFTGLPRHDLMASIIREHFNWSNIFGTQCHIVSNKETITDNNYLVRTLVFKSTNLNNIVYTNTDSHGKKKSTMVINNIGRS